MRTHTQTAKARAKAKEGRNDLGIYSIYNIMILYTEN